MGVANYYQQNRTLPLLLFFFTPCSSKLRVIFTFLNARGKEEWWKLHELQILVSINKMKCNHTIPFCIAYGCFQLQWHSWVIILKRPCGQHGPLLKKFTQTHSLLTDWLASHSTMSCKNVSLLAKTNLMASFMILNSQFHFIFILINIYMTLWFLFHYRFLGLGSFLEKYAILRSCDPDTLKLLS